MCLVFVPRNLQSISGRNSNVDTLGIPLGRNKDLSGRNRLRRSTFEGEAQLRCYVGEGHRLAYSSHFPGDGRWAVCCQVITDGGHTPRHLGRDGFKGACGNPSFWIALDEVSNPRSKKKKKKKKNQDVTRGNHKISEMSLRYLGAVFSWLEAPTGEFRVSSDFAGHLWPLGVHHRLGGNSKGPANNSINHLNNTQIARGCGPKGPGGGVNQSRPVVEIQNLNQLSKVKELIP